LGSALHRPALRVGPTVDLPVDGRLVVETPEHGPESSGPSLGENVQPDETVPDRHTKHVPGVVVADEIQRHRQLEEVSVPVRTNLQYLLDETVELVGVALGRRLETEHRLALVLDAALEGKPPTGASGNRKRRVAGHLCLSYVPSLFKLAGVSGCMCGRYSLFAPPDDIEDRFGATFTAAFEPRYNAAPSQPLPVISDAAPGTLERMEWGFVPPWADDRSDFGFINARAETLAEKSTFRGAFGRDSSEPGDLRVGRCLVPADGFYEWVETDDGTRPYRVTLTDGEPFAMAGLWAEWRPDGTQTGLDAFGGGDRPDVEPDVVSTFAVVTTEPNALVADLHHRMCVILPRGEERRWLQDGTDAVTDLLTPYPADETRAYPVSRAVNDPSNDSPVVAEPVDDEDDGVSFAGG
jgi:putative SOS response-associated peptidase YedK